MFIISIALVQTGSIWESNSWSRNYLLYRSTIVYTLFLLGVHVAQVLDFCVVFCRSLFVLLSLFFWPLCCLFFEVRFLLPLSPLPIFCRRIHQYMNITVYLNLVMIWPDMCTSSYLITSCHCCTI